MRAFMSAILGSILFLLVVSEEPGFGSFFNVDQLRDCSMKLAICSVQQSDIMNKLNGLLITFGTLKTLLEFRIQSEVQKCTSPNILSSITTEAPLTTPETPSCAREVLSTSTTETPYPCGKTTTPTSTTSAPSVDIPPCGRALPLTTQAPLTESFRDDPSTATEPLTTTEVTTTTEPSTTSVPTTTTEVSYFCGTFKKYNSFYDRLAPETEGFAGGVNYDGTIEYVGYGNGHCSGQNPSSGFISTKSSAPGAYISCASGIKYDNTNDHFILKHKNLKWVKTSTAGLAHLHNAVKIQGSHMHFMFGRTFYNGEYRMGKVPYNKLHGLWFILENNRERRLLKDFEVLVCEGS